MHTIVTIVEGPGDVDALPILLRQLVNWEIYSVNFPRPKNAHGKTNLTKPNGIEQFLDLARREPSCDGVLILIDADEECSVELSRGLKQRVMKIGLPFPVAIVCAVCEYEAWFLASLETIAGQLNTNLPMEVRYDGNPETVRGVKEWLTRQMEGGFVYKETQHQATMSSLLDPLLARSKSRSFRRLEHALEELLTSIKPDSSA